MGASLYSRLCVTLLALGGAAQHEAPAGRDLELELKLPVQCTVCEPVAYFLVLTNKAKDPISVDPDFSQRGPRVYAHVQDTDGTVLPIATGANAATREPPNPVILVPGQSLRHKHWIIRTKDMDRKERFVFQSPGKYVVQMRYTATRMDSDPLHAQATIEAVAPTNRELVDLLRKPVKAEPPFAHVASHLQLWLPSAMGISVGSVRGIKSEKGQDRQKAILERLREVYERFPDSPYAWYAAVAVARWEAHEADSPGFYQKPANVKKAAEILESIEDRPMTSALREEVLALQAEVYFALNQRQKAEQCLKKLEAMDPAEPLASEIPRIRQTWRPRSP